MKKVSSNPKFSLIFIKKKLVHLVFANTAIGQSVGCTFWAHHTAGGPDHWQLELCDYIVDRSFRKSVEY